MLAPEIQCGFAQGVVGTVGSGCAGIGIAAFPGFDRGIDIKHFFFVTERHQGQTGNKYGKIDQKIAFFKQRFEYLPVIVFRQTDLLVRYAVLTGDLFVIGIG